MSIRSETRKAIDLLAVCAENLRGWVWKEDRDGRLVILDDAFPHLFSAFRVAEDNGYLERFPDSRVHSTGGAFSSIDARRSFDAVRREYAAAYPHLGDRVMRFHRMRSIEGCCAYTVFLQNAHGFLSYLRRSRAPFAFTLYPGGGFRLGQEESDKSLREVFDDRGFRKVIVTQKISRDYLLDRGFVDRERVEFIYGCVLPTEPLTRGEHPKLRFLESKDTLDICFVAFKYMVHGKDKGYDLFIETARRLARRAGNFRFHVVGPFDSTDIDVRDLGGRILFHGRHTTDFFPAFYAGMDLILSPNIPFVLYPGSFDGFPTGACMEAGICGVAVFCSDVLKQNILFRDREEIVIVPPDPAEIEDTIWGYYRNPDALYRLSERGMEAFREAFDLTRQMEPRLRLIGGFLAG